MSNEDLMKNDLKDFVRSSVEEVLNALLNKEADELINEYKYERSYECQGYVLAIIKGIFRPLPEMWGCGFMSTFWTKKDSYVCRVCLPFFLDFLWSFVIINMVFILINKDCQSYNYRR